jgi:class 3 adenylate cyclase
MLPERADHACAALRLGLDMHAAAASVEIGDGRCVQVRVGMHSGEVTSGIIGHVRARFCLFGGARALSCFTFYEPSSHHAQFAQIR